MQKQMIYNTFATSRDYLPRISIYYKTSKTVFVVKIALKLFSQRIGAYYVESTKAAFALKFNLWLVQPGMDGPKTFGSMLTSYRRLTSTSG